LLGIDELKTQLRPVDWLIVKGDANYRRLLGDCQWLPTTSFQEIVSYLPQPLAALRTLKSELVVGMTALQIETLNQRAPDWLTSGEWGVIQVAH
jgi:hypothetical protein